MAVGDLDSVARQLISAAGGRQTKPRALVLAALMRSSGMLSHADFQNMLPTVDRVSLYRALDWLAEHQLAHRTTGMDGVRRYGKSHNGHKHPHFQCTNCGLTTCLEQDIRLSIEIPRGFQQSMLEVLVKGLCNTCGQLG